MRILIAEDDLTSRKMLAVTLKKNDYEVVETTNGADALQVMLSPDAPRLAILDWMMPEIDGLEVCRRVRARSEENPPYIIMLTTRGEAAEIVEALNTGADDYLVKPYNARELCARVNVGHRLTLLQDALALKVHELSSALTHIRTLHGILPICSFCKKIRDDSGYWSQIEAYISEHSNADFSHGICPECMIKNYPQYCEE